MLVEQYVRPVPLSVVRKNKIVNLHNVTVAEVFQSDFPRRRMLVRDAFSYAKSRRARVVPPLQLVKNPRSRSAVASYPLRRSK